ncbi:WD-40 repeat protein [Reticulomyxa filosa]|uniref:WD-40 repeat protein n=1 Tax=Reticulomyxa filosa TaxID=46433 RepID=X6MML8_RETFI|nr:WD-40 repeat protein [Reticulomyxa filosa]|eukprot:ETO15263.1 WD-40 repeat protein [Reticulomyxa filosa]
MCGVLIIRHLITIDYCALDQVIKQFVCVCVCVCVCGILRLPIKFDFSNIQRKYIVQKFSPYHYHNHRRSVICSSSYDNAIRHTDCVFGIEFSPFHGGRYLCSGSDGINLCLWDVETSKILHVFKGHTNWVWCVAFSPLQSSNDSNHVGSGYTICSGSYDSTIRIWDIETAKELSILKGHECYVWCAKYLPYELGTIGGSNTIIFGSQDKSVRLWDIRSNQQSHVFKGHTQDVTCVECLPFINSYTSIICSGSYDNTIRLWDFRLNKELHVIKGKDEQDDGIVCLRFLPLKNKEKDNQNINNDHCDSNLFYSYLEINKLITYFFVLIIIVYKKICFIVYQKRMNQLLQKKNSLKQIFITFAILFVKRQFYFEIFK